MTFVNKYPNLGKTIKMRLPAAYEQHFYLIADEYERIAKETGRELLSQMQGRLEDSLCNIQWEHVWSTVLLCAPH